MFNLDIMLWNSCPFEDTIQKNQSQRATKTVWMGLIQTQNPWESDVTLLRNSDVRLEDKRQTHQHLLFIFAGKNHFDLGNEVNTAAKWQSWCFSLKAASRKIQHKDRAVSFSIMVTLGFGPLRQLWITWHIFPLLFCQSLRGSNIEPEESRSEQLCEGLWPSTLALPCAEHLDWSIIISSHTRLHSVHCDTPHRRCLRLLTVTVFKKLRVSLTRCFHWKITLHIANQQLQNDNTAS